MSVGAKEGVRVIFRFLRVFPVKIKGFSLIEVLVSMLLLGIIMSALFIALNIGESGNSISGVKVEMQAATRNLMDWIARDIRGVIGSEIAQAVNTPSGTHLKFNLWQWSDASNTWYITGDYIDYNYDPVFDRITRSLISGGNVMQTWNFSDIVENPFYTTYNDTTKEFVEYDFEITKKLIVLISMQRTAIGGRVITTTLREELKIRNE